MMWAKGSLESPPPAVFLQYAKIAFANYKERIGTFVHQAEEVSGEGLRGKGIEGKLHLLFIAFYFLGIF
ncbi:MAG: hypothetical protein ACK559_42320, partial [bacterium]